MEPTERYFKPQDMWRGGFYEIEMQLGARSDERLALALESVWSGPHPSVEGCYLHRDQEPHVQKSVNPREHAGEGHLYGIARVPNGAKVCFGTYVTRTQCDDGKPLADFLGFYLPLASLGTAYKVGAYPFGDIAQARVWVDELNGWLLGLGKFVFSRLSYEGAVIGFEVDFPNSNKIRDEVIPKERYQGYLWPVNGRLEWYPPNNC
jgi:hypothetical protein